jgi:ComF family protein
MTSLHPGSFGSRAWRPFWPALRAAGRHLLDAVLPPQCLACRAIVAEPGQLCAECWRGIRFIEAPLCAVCGRPFEFDAGPEALCGDCAARPPAYGCARSVMVYDDKSRDLILGFKRGDRLEGAPAFGAWMARSGKVLIEGVDLVVPVPLHRTRLFTRRFNQAAVLALAISRATGLPVLPDALMRTRATPSQAGLSRSGRFRNVRGAFTVRPRRKEGIRGRRIVLIDDVMTTGATVEGCSRALLKAGAASVSALTLARVVHGL